MKAFGRTIVKQNVRWNSELVLAATQRRNIRESSAQSRRAVTCLSPFVAVITRRNEGARVAQKRRMLFEMKSCCGMKAYAYREECCKRGKMWCDADSRQKIANGFTFLSWARQVESSADCGTIKGRRLEEDGIPDASMTHNHSHRLTLHSADTINSEFSGSTSLVSKSTVPHIFRSTISQRSTAV